MDLDHNLNDGAGTMFAGKVQQMRGQSVEPGPSFKSNSVAIAKAAALQSLNRPVTKATRKPHTSYLQEMWCGFMSRKERGEVLYKYVPGLWFEELPGKEP